MNERGLSGNTVANISGVSAKTIGTAIKSGRISLASAEKIAVALDVPVRTIFTVHEQPGGLSDQTIAHHHRLICAILSKAKRERIIPFNPASEHMDAPKVKRKEARYLSDTQAQQLVDILWQEEDIRKKTALLLCLFSGIRRGECGGLQWKDVDSKNRVIHVRRAIQWQKNKGVVEVDTKNESGRRVIGLPQRIFDLLDRYRVYWMEQKLICGDRWVGDDWIFIGETGRPLSLNRLNVWLRELTTENDLPHITPHGLRHTFCSLQIAAGVNIRTVQARSGHSRASTYLKLCNDTFFHA